MKQLRLAVLVCLIWISFDAQTQNESVAQDSALAESASKSVFPLDWLNFDAGEPGADESAACAASEQLVWNYEAYLAVVEKTEGKSPLSEKAFDAVQVRKTYCLELVEKYLKQKFGDANPAVIRAFSEVPREVFHYNYEGKYTTGANAYETHAKPWGIGYGSVLSDYLGQLYMTQLADPKPDMVVLEIGTGSGFQSSLLSRLVKKVYSIEIIEPLGNAVATTIQALHYGNVSTRVGDGYFGWPEVEGGFDLIMVTCAARHVPQALIDQLKPNGILMIPVGPAIKGRQVLFVYTKDGEGKVRSRRDTGVYFIAMTGRMLKGPR